MKDNYTYYAIIVYIIIILSLVALKPNLIYDHNKNEYREFGFGGNRTLLSLPVISVLVAIFVFLIFLQFSESDNKKENQTSFVSVVNPNNQIMPPMSYYPMFVYPTPPLNNIPNLVNATTT